MPVHAPDERLTIGVLTGWQYYWTATPLSYLAPLVRGMCLAAHHLNCNLLLGCGIGSSATSADPLRPAWPIPSPETDFVPVGPWNTDGLIAITPLYTPDRSRDVQAMIAAGHPVLFVGSGERGPTLAADNTTGILEAMRHLVGHGHRQIAFIAGSPEDLDGDSGDRLRAYQAALHTHGIPPDPRLVAYGRHVYTTGQTAMGQILKSGVPFTAVLASNDESALGAIQALTEAGRRIPHDVAVIGFDDRPESSVQKPALSSIRIPLFRMGYRAVELLVQIIAGEAVRDACVRIPTRLVCRESCGCGHAGGFTPLPAPSVPLQAESDPQAWRAEVAQAMTAVVLAETQSVAEAEVRAFCLRLVEGLAASVARQNPAEFYEVLDSVLHDNAFAQEDAHVWQVAISVLQQAAQPQAQFRELFDRVRTTISEHMQRQHRQFVVNERWLANRMGVLTAQLSSALDEMQVFQTLARHLPAMGIARAWVALFEAADTPDALTRCSLHNLTALDQPTVDCRSRDFPPSGLLPVTEPLSLALLPLVNPRGQLGFVAFDSGHLDLYGAIVQQLAAALHTTQLYREALEGRRLAEEANQIKSRFLSTVSHELRTPLNLIVGLSRMLLHKGDENAISLPEIYRDDLERINANAQHLGGLIGDVLDLASSDAGQLRLSTEYIDLSQTLRMVVETGSRLAQDKGLVWHATLPERGPWVLGDRTRLRQVALNLISNAIKFTRQGFVQLTVETGVDFAQISVSDSGLGIPPDEQSAIFSEFRRSNSSVTRGYGGLGLGLSICKRLVELHGGSITVQSTGREGEGATFSFTLPVVAMPEMPTSRLADQIGGTECIMVLTNRASSGQRLREHLRQRGFDVQLATDTANWSARLAVALPSAIVLDMTSEPAHGWETLKTLKSNPRTRGVPVLFYTLAQDSGSVLELDYLTKPIELAELTQALDQHWLANTSPQATMSVLVVDDDPGTLDMYARIIQTHWLDAQVLKANDGRMALEILQHKHIDLVLLDLMMPEIDGFGVLEAMRQEEATRDIPVIVVTGQVLSQDDMARLNQGVAAVMSKGLFNASETLAHLDAALERQRKLSSEAQRLVRMSMAYVHEHYAEPISRQDLARHVSMAEDYLTSCFHKEVGMAPIAYLNRYRINQAKLLLKQSEASITDIAIAVGFSDRGYFSRVFRREVGMAPEVYRRAQM